MATVSSLATPRSAWASVPTPGVIDHAAPSVVASAPLAESHVACQTVIHARGLLSSGRALAGHAPSFAAVSDSALRLDRSLSQAPDRVRVPMAPVVARIRRSAELLLAMRAAVLQSREALGSIRKDSADLLEAAEGVMTAELVASSGAARIAAANQLTMLTQRMAKSAGEVVATPGAIEPESVFLLGKDPKSFMLLATSLRDGNPNLRLKPADTAAKARITQLLKRFEATRQASELVLSNLRELIGAKEAHEMLQLDAEAIERALLAMCFSHG